MTTGAKASISLGELIPARPSHTDLKIGMLSGGTCTDLGEAGREGCGVAGIDRAESAAAEMAVGVCMKDDGVPGGIAFIGTRPGGHRSGWIKPSGR